MADNFDQQLSQFFRKLDNAIVDYNRKDRKRITRKAASKVAVQARRKGQQAFSDSKRPHYRGRKPKRVKYNPGNLRRSNKVLTKTGRFDSFVGPVRAPRSGVPGRGKKATEYGGAGQPVDGYYAQMVFGSAIAYRQRVLVAAVRNARPAALKIMRTEMRKAIITRGVRRGIKRG